MELRQLVGMWFQVLSLPLKGFFSSFARATCELSVVREYLALGDGPPRFNPDSSWPDLLGYSQEDRPLSRTGLSPSMVPLSNGILLTGNFVTSQL